MRPIRKDVTRPKRCYCRKCHNCIGFGNEIIRQGHQAFGGTVSKPRYECKKCGHWFVVGDRRERNTCPHADERCEWPSGCRKKGRHIHTNSRLCSKHLGPFHRNMEAITQQILKRNREYLERRIEQEKRKQQGFPD